MEEDVAVKHEFARGGGVTEIHAHFYAVVGTAAGPVGNLKAVPEILVGYGFSIDFEHHEVDLMHVEVVRLKGAVLDGPVFDRSHLSGDHGLLVGLENLFLLSIDGDVELNRAVGA